MGIRFAGAPPFLRCLVPTVIRTLSLAVFLLSLRLEFSPDSSLAILLRLFSRFELFAPSLLQRNVMKKLFLGDIENMDSTSYTNSRPPRRHTIAPSSRHSSSQGPTAVTNNETKQYPPPSPTTSGTLSPSIASTSNRSSALYESNDPTTDRQHKRLSLNFPIQPPNGRTRPQSWLGSSTLSSPVIPSAESSPTTGNFLTALAAQERRVLELKEELQKAEYNLLSLKKQWALHEVARKRNDVRNRTQTLQPINTSLSTVNSPTDDSDGQSWMQKEMERRKALLSAPRQSSRTVFSGSRHTRQLSLLSPDKSYTPSFPQPSDLNETEDSPLTPQASVSSTTVPDTVSTSSRIDESSDGRTMQSDALLRTGKKMATDFKDGLWTFIEDLRQATVGDEGVNGQQSRSNHGVSGPKTTRQPNKANLKTQKNGVDNRPQSWAPQKSENDTLIDIGGSFWKEHGLDDTKATNAKSRKPQMKYAKTPQKQLRRAVDDQGESWDTWDTPHERNTLPVTSSDSVSDGRSTPRSNRSTPRTSTSSTADITSAEIAGHSRKDSIPWPALENFSPTNLKRTASHLMREWEKSLTPPAESREHTASGDYIGRAISPTPDENTKID